MKNRKKNSEQTVVISVPGEPEKQIVIVEKAPIKMICTYLCGAKGKRGTDERLTPQVITILRPVHQR